MDIGYHINGEWAELLYEKAKSVIKFTRNYVINWLQ